VPISPNIPKWPGSPAIRLERNLNLELGDIANDTTINFSVHTGTHVDAPLHFLPDGSSVDQMSLEVVIGPAFVADLSDVEVITANILEKLALPANTQRLLLRTRNSHLWESEVQEFQKNFVALTADAAHWVVNHGIRLIGIDYLSIQRFGDEPETHVILLKSEVVIVEGLNLADVLPGEYDLICLPLKLQGVEGAPARVVLREKL
jgi:arylformamidase